MEDDALSTHRKVKTSLGSAFVLRNIELVDTIPQLLASGLALWIEEEWPFVVAKPPPERERAWARRLKDLAHEALLRAQNPGRTVYGNAPVARFKAPTSPDLPEVVEA